MNPSEIWLINLNPTMGAEIQKIRPAVIVNNTVLGKLPLKIIVPVTDWKDKYAIAPWMVKIEPNGTNGLTKISAIDCFQIRSVAEERLIRKIGTVDNFCLDEIKEALKKVLDI